MSAAGSPAPDAVDSDRSAGVAVELGTARAKIAALEVQLYRDQQSAQQQVQQLQVQLEEVSKQAADSSRQLERMRSTMAGLVGQAVPGPALEHMLVVRYRSMEKHLEEARAKLAVAERAAKHKAEEVDLLSEALEDKHAVAVASERKSAQMEQHISQPTLRCREVGAIRGVVQTLQLQIAQLQPPPTCDAAMSARSFHEDRLLGARDEAIHSLRRQLDVVTDGNGALQEQVDAAEQEIARLQEVMQQRDVASHALKTATAQNTELLHLLQKQEQTERMLREEAEMARVSLNEVREQFRALKFASAETEAANILALHEARDSQAKLQDTLAGAQQELTLLRAQLAGQEEKANRKITAMDKELQQRRHKQYEMLEHMTSAEQRMREAQDQCEKYKDEMRTCRTEMATLAAKVASLTDELTQLGAAAASVASEMGLNAPVGAGGSRRASPAARAAALLQHDPALPLYAALRRKAAEAEARKRAQQVALADAAAAAEKQVEQLLGELDRERKERERVDAMLQELSDTVFKLVERQKEADLEIQKLLHNIADRDRELDETRGRIARLLEDCMRYDTARGAALAEQKRLRKAVAELEEERARFLALKKVPEAQIRRRCHILVERCRAEQRARSKLVQRYVAAACGMRDKILALVQKRLRRHRATDAGGAPGSDDDGGGEHAANDAASPASRAPRAGASLPASVRHSLLRLNPGLRLDLSICGLGDGDVVALCASLRRFRQECVETLDLQGNAISDEGARALAPLLRVSARLQLVDLRGNALSPLGIQELADALEGNIALTVQHVHVTEGGKVEVMGLRPRRRREDWTWCDLQTLQPAPEQDETEAEAEEAAVAVEAAEAGEAEEAAGRASAAREAAGGARTERFGIIAVVDARDNDPQAARTLTVMGAGEGAGSAVSASDGVASLVQGGTRGGRRRSAAIGTPHSTTRRTASLASMGEEAVLATALAAVPGAEDGEGGTDVDPRSASGTLALSPTALLRTSTAASVGPSGPPSAVASAQERLAGSLPRAASERALPPSTQHIPPPLAPPRRPRLSDSLREEQREVQRAALRHDKEVAHWQSLGGSAGRQLRHERLDDAQRGVAGEGSLLDGETADESLRRMAEGRAKYLAHAAQRAKSRSHDRAGSPQPAQRERASSTRSTSSVSLPSVTAGAAQRVASRSGLESRMSLRQYASALIDEL